MAFESRQFDDHGLPIPQRFVDYRQPDEEAQQKPKISPRAKRIVVVSLLFGVMAIVFAPYVIKAGREAVAQWFSSRAERKLMQRDFRGAIDDMTWAIDCNPDDWNLYRFRGVLHQELQELDATLADFTKTIDLLETTENAGRLRLRRTDRGEVLAMMYSQRSWIHVRLDHGREAIDDATEAVKRLPNATTYNARAYARAVMNTELKEGLDDIDTALKTAGANDADFRDTRGFLLYLLDKPDDALVELNRAIKDTEARQNDFAFQPNFFGRRDAAEWDHALAVMYHHRGMVHEKLGNHAQAKNDLEHGDQLGYDRAKGVF